MTVIGVRLRAARKAAGMSQEVLAIEAGIDPVSASARMSQYETGKYEPTYSTMQQISAVLRVPVAYFYCDDDAMARLLLDYSRASLRDREAVERIVGALAIENPIGRPAPRKPRKDS